MDYEELGTAVKVQADEELKAHVLALTGALTAGHFFETLNPTGVFQGSTGEVVAMSAYLLTIILFQGKAISNQFSASAWRRRLNQRRQILAPGQILSKTLHSAARLIALRSIGSKLGMALMLVWIFKSGARPFHIADSVVVIFCLFVIANEGTEFVEQLVTALRQERSPKLEMITFEAPRSEPRAWRILRLFQTLKDHIDRTVLTVVLILGAVNWVVARWDKISHLPVIHYLLRVIFGGD